MDNFQFPNLIVGSTQSGFPWSRTQGAMGIEAWERYTQIPMSVIGIGRTGSLVAEALVRSGVQQITLIDKDVVEPHNLAEMALLTIEDLGKSKVGAIATYLQRLNWAKCINSIEESILHVRSRNAAAETPILFQCVDNDAARLTSAVIASSYHRVLIDIATGIHVDKEQRRIGADIRFIIPGDHCLLCCGGVTEFRKSMHSLITDGTIKSFDWQETRAGSLRSLNQIATGIALRLCEDFFTEHLTQSTWLRLEFSEQGIPSIHKMPITSLPDCLLCARAGVGDAGFA